MFSFHSPCQSVFGRAWGMILGIPGALRIWEQQDVAITAPQYKLPQILGQVHVKKPKYEKFLGKLEDSAFSLGIMLCYYF